eukprot:TRINITY_DN16006_c1_g1_i5.p1 TRINITY_DN16006_c1_g1~~TRINITY_DN16006_c1_g1_i5.p1  ORF type:complete len:445 (-),score=110.03 TRINITY_DN16006_c1_g1_i5:343-1617(-)
MTSKVRTRRSTILSLLTIAALAMGIVSKGKLPSAFLGQIAPQSTGEVADQPLHRPALPAAALTSEETRIMKFFEATTPSVVSISKKPAAVQGIQGRPNEERAGNVYGSGFVWDEEHIVTNYHVVQGKDLNWVTFLSKDKRGQYDQRTSVAATVVGFDATSDVAVLKISNMTFTGGKLPENLMVPLPRRELSSKGLGVGQEVLAVGNPFGFEHSLSRGIISGVSRSMSSFGRPLQGIIQTDASINPGNSGGPLLDSDGKVIGVNAAIISTGGTFAGVGLAIPIDTVASNVESILKKGFVGRPFIGITFAPDTFAEEVGVSGVVTMKVVKGSPAEKAGVRGMKAGRLGDIVVGLDGERIASGDDLFKLLDDKKEGDQVRLQVQRPPKDPDTDKFEDIELTLKLGVTVAGSSANSTTGNLQQDSGSE